MKNFIIFLLLASVLFSLPSCTDINGEGGDGMQTEKFTLYAIVKDVGDKLEVEVVESDYAFGIYWVIVPEGTPVCNAEGESISLTDLRAGDRIEIVYNGQTMLSYPPQIVALSVKVVD